MVVQRRRIWVFAWVLLVALNLHGAASGMEVVDNSATYRLPIPSDLYVHMVPVSRDVRHPIPSFYFNETNRADKFIQIIHSVCYINLQNKSSMTIHMDLMTRAEYGQFEKTILQRNRWLRSGDVVAGETRNGVAYTRLTYVPNEEVMVGRMGVEARRIVYILRGQEEGKGLVVVIEVSREADRAPYEAILEAAETLAEGESAFLPDQLLLLDRDVNQFKTALLNTIEVSYESYLKSLNIHTYREPTVEDIDYILVDRFFRTLLRQELSKTTIHAEKIDQLLASFESHMQPLIFLAVTRFVSEQHRKRQMDYRASFNRAYRQYTHAIRNHGKGSFAEQVTRLSAQMRTYSHEFPSARGHTTFDESTRRAIQADYEFTLEYTQTADRVFGLFALRFYLDPASTSTSAYKVAHGFARKYKDMDRVRRPHQYVMAVLNLFADHVDAGAQEGGQPISAAKSGVDPRRIQALVHRREQLELQRRIESLEEEIAAKQSVVQALIEQAEAGDIDLLDLILEKNSNLEKRIETLTELKQQLD